MRATVLYGPRDIRFEERADPRISEPGDAIIRLAASCICGSDLWPYRGLNPTREAVGRRCSGAAAQGAHG
jgi:threonine dehydrogenase-like Zn-dependent dehydrogenase